MAIGRCRVDVWMLIVGRLVRMQQDEASHASSQAGELASGLRVRCAHQRKVAKDGSVSTRSCNKLHLQVQVGGLAGGCVLRWPVVVSAPVLVLLLVLLAVP